MVLSRAFLRDDQVFGAQAFMRDDLIHARVGAGQTFGVGGCAKVRIALSVAGKVQGAHAALEGADHRGKELAVRLLRRGTWTAEEGEFPFVFAKIVGHATS